MLKKILLPAVAAALAALLTPSQVDAYGAAHVGYTHVGPNGVYHAGATAVSGPGGAYAGSRTTAVGAGGGAYHSASGAGYRYAPGYSGGAAVGKTSYAYIR